MFLPLRTVACVLLTSLASAQQELHELGASDAWSGDGFGGSVSIHAGRAVVGPLRAYPGIP